MQALSNLEASKQLINRSYLAKLEHNAVLPYPQSASPFIAAGDARIFRIERVVQSNKQSVLESLTAAYTALGAAGYTVFLYLNSNGQETEVFIGTRGEPGRMEGQNSGALLEESFKGHFAGSSLMSLNGSEVRELLGNLEQTKESPTTSVTAVTGVPALSTENRDHFMQGLERFIDAAEQRIYHALILAEPVSPSNLDVIKQGYEQVATQLSPLLKTQLSYGEQDSESIGVTLTTSISESLGQSLALTETKGNSHTDGTTSTSTKGTSESFSSQTTASKAASIIGSAIAAGCAFGGPLGAIAGAQIGGIIATAFSEQRTSGTNESLSEGTSISDTTSHSTAEATTHTSTHMKGTSDARSRNLTTGQTRQHSLEIIDKGVEQLLEKISHHLKRIDEAKAYGGWNAAAYFISDSSASSETLASIFLGLIRGESSSAEDFALSTWKSSAKNAVLEWLGRLTHPQLKSNFSHHVPIQYLTPATLVTGKEMAIQLSLPRRSTSTVAVVETQAFGRSVRRLDGESLDATSTRTLQLGKVRHLWKDSEHHITLDMDHLASHVFVSGSTGAGKSNTVYALLDQVSQASLNFLVIEPAKGEYKHVFGLRNDVRVLGTNPKEAELLRINPFAFPKNIHVLEHIDRLVEIFNVCWPMYAAMPAVLKTAMLAAYEQAGWNLDDSENPYGEEYFPTFGDLQEALQKVIRDSAYAQEVKSNYEGSLLTRVQSLTNGLNGQIFSAHEIDSSALFDSKAIIDLSRVGSAETKALLMGVLIMRLSEYRMASGKMNAPLSHVTVLEEAHNILRASTFGPEGAGVQGKAVEMLTNAIAEMRTYGEGFIIVDQSPNAVDIAAIRNTNTKIIMRLPEESDRRLLGKSAALTDDQLEEITRLPKGIAVVYQNDWLEPVLCHIDKFKGQEGVYEYGGKQKRLDKARFQTEILKLLLQKRAKLDAPDAGLIERGLGELPLLTRHRIKLGKVLAAYRDNREHPLLQQARFCDLSSFVVELLGCRDQVRMQVGNSDDGEDLNNSLQNLLFPLCDSSPELMQATSHCLMKDFAMQNTDNQDIYEKWHVYAEKGFQC